MENIQRGRFTISANILMTSTFMTRAFTFGFIMVAVYIKTVEDIFATNVVRVVDTYDINGIPFGSAVKSVIFSLAGVFALDLITGILGLYGVLRKQKLGLIAGMLLSILMLCVYIAYMILLSIFYYRRSGLGTILAHYMDMARENYLSYTYRTYVIPSFVSVLGCSRYNGYSCAQVYIEQLETYLQAYLGLLTTCIVCQIISAVAIEYTFRKFEIKEEDKRISNCSYMLLCTCKYGIFRFIVVAIKDQWKRSKTLFVTVMLKIICLVTGIGLFALGLTVVSHNLIANEHLKRLLAKLEFRNYYLSDILVGLAAASIVLGVLTITTAILSLIGTWRRSQNLLKASTVLSLLTLLQRLACISIWTVFLIEINGNLRYQLLVHQQGYHLYQNDGSRLHNNPYPSFDTEAIASWQAMFMKMLITTELSILK